MEQASAEFQEVVALVLSTVRNRLAGQEHGGQVGELLQRLSDKRRQEAQWALAEWMEGGGKVQTASLPARQTRA